jgi:hypothetical protein
MQYLMAPLEEHYDNGFGAVGEAFREAAKALANANGQQQRIFWSDLPVIYLLRHVIELFLKSGIVIIHRKLQLPYGSQSLSSSEPKLMTQAGSWKSISATHNLTDLYWYWKKLMTENKSKLTEMTKFKPDITVPGELDGWIETVSAADPNSDYFRYPVTRNRSADKEKSSFREVSVESLFPAEADQKRVFALVTKDDEGNLVRAFKHDQSTNQEIEEAAWKAAEMLDNFHIMMRMELTGGW